MFIPFFVFIPNGLGGQFSSEKWMKHTKFVKFLFLVKDCDRTLVMICLLFYKCPFEDVDITYIFITVLYKLEPCLVEGS